MFSFHKPRVYRSTEGCCICRAKSSSSRFTDSRKYEVDSMKCFDLQNPRKGEICNACVLLVKRFKRLPVGSKRHWGHVVDARVGPKSMTKYKKYREDNENNKNRNTSTSRHITQSNKSVLSEKFSKIFKKTKKNQNTTKKDNVKRSPTRATAQQNWDSQQPSLPTTPDSLDSDYDESRLGSQANCTVVEFQTQTRASSYRSRNTNAPVGMSIVCENVRFKQPLKMVRKRRKCLLPRKNRRAIDNEPFFDVAEWEQRKSCCGIVYKCPLLPGTFIIDSDYYKPCAEHVKPIEISVVPIQKPIIATMPAIVNLAPPTLPLKNMNPTPVLKKHHLFFKRQSESFPQGDIVMKNNENSTINQIKTDATLTPRPIPTVQQSIMTAPANLNSTIMSPVAGCGTQQPYTAVVPSHNMPRPSTTRITAITPNINNSPNVNQQSNSIVLHKIKSDTSKIVKHSLDKINTTVRIKSHELQDMKHIIKTVDKSFVLSKPSSTSIHNVSHYQQFYGAPQTSTTHSSGSSSAGSSPASSTKFSDNSSDSGFDENMLDRKSASPLQEDTEKKMLTRIPEVQTLILANGIQIQGQPQNVALAGVETASKILQNRKQQAVITSLKQQQQIINHATTLAAPATAPVKITQLVGNGSHAKMRAIYNNNATIQHENGVTTIVPASSLAATTQTAAMNNAILAPSTVTITPAPPTHINMPSAATSMPLALSTLNGKKLASTTNLIGLSSGNNSSSSSCGNNIGITTISNNQSNIHSIGVSSILGTINNISNNSNNNNNNNSNINNNASSLNQKIVLLKNVTTKYNICKN